MITNYVKKYFKSSGTVSKWWNPTEGDFSEIFEHQIKLIEQKLQFLSGKSCLEVSCGKGRTTEVLNRLFDLTISCDISQEMLDIAANRFPPGIFKLEDAENLSFQDESFDVVICLEALVHYPNPDKAIAEFFRVLKTGGILIIDFDNKYSLRRLVKRSFYSIIKDNNPGKNIFNAYSNKEFLRILSGHKYKIEFIDLIGTVVPIKIYTDSSFFYVLSPKVHSYLNWKIWDKIPIINKLATYYVYYITKNND